MNSRTNFSTTIAPYTDRESAWKQAIEAAEKHAKMGLSLQGQGIEILRTKQDTDPESTVGTVHRQAGCPINAGTLANNSLKRS